MTEIEPADLSDLDALVACWVDLAAEQREHASHLLAAPNRDVVRESLGHHVLSGNLLVARDEAVDDRGNVVGFVSFGPQSDSFERDRTRGFVRNVYVRPAYRGEGIGSRLLDEAERRMQEDGVEVVALEVMADNEAARRLYRNRGYDPHRVELEKSLGSDTHTN